MAAAMLSFSARFSSLSGTRCSPAARHAGRVPAMAVPAARRSACAVECSGSSSRSSRLEKAADVTTEQLSRRSLLAAGLLAAGAPAARADELEVQGVPADPPPPVKKAPANCQILVVRKGPDDESKCEWGE